MTKAIALGVAGFIAMLVMMELLLRVLPVSTSTETGYYTDPVIVTYPPDHRWTLSTGWDLRNAQTMTANHTGYAATREFTRDVHAVALVGDSFVEASMLAAVDRPAAQLERLLDSRPVYAMGSPGTALLDYAERIRFAHEHFGTRDFVMLMERGDVLQSLCGSGNSHGPCLDPVTLQPRVEKRESPGTAKRIIRHSALAQYLVSQLKFSMARLQANAFASPPPSGPADPARATEPQTVPPHAVLARVDAVAGTFFQRIKPHLEGQLIVVLDSDRQAMWHGRWKADPARSHFIRWARQAGAVVVDTEPLFLAHFQKSRLSLDVGPYDGHLNEIGVNLVMQAAAAALKQLPPAPE